MDLDIEEGEFVAIMGPSGSGKSTLMQILGLLDRPSAGTYRLMGRDVSRLSDDEGAALRSKAIGFIFQMFNLLPRTTTLDNVILPMIYSRAPRREERARELLGEVGLADRVRHKPNELSGGQQQRVAIARALVNRPRIIFADEPTGNLASDQASLILGQLKLLNQAGITIIMVTHEPDIAGQAERIIRIRDGVIIADESRAGSSPGRGAVVAAPPRARAAEPVPASWLTFAQFRENGGSALRAMSANKLRSSLSMLGILIGVAAVIAMLAVGQGAQKAIESRISGLGSNLLALRPEGRDIGGVRSAAGSVSRLNQDDVRAIAGLTGVLRAEGNVQGAEQIVYGDKNAATQVVGATPLYETMRNSRPYWGRFFTDEESKAQARVLLIGATVAEKLFGPQDPLDQFVRVGRASFKVIGVLPKKGASSFRDQDDVVIIPLDTAMKRVFGQTHLDTIFAECETPDAIPSVITDIQALMRRRHRLPDHREDDFAIRNMAELQAALSGTTQTFRLLLGIVAGISLLVGGIGIMNIMLVSVSERTREIGLRKAVGAPRHAILSQFLIESAVLATCGGLLGILVGVSVSLTLSKFAGWAAIVSPEAVLLAFAFSAGVGVIFGFWPARKASLLSPIEALRYE